ncbi:DUF4198 domain-containing protein [soil metagenome]
MIRHSRLRHTAALVLGLLSVSPAFAHRAWMLPSSTVLSGNDAWVTIDAAVSNDLFYFDHMPLRLDNLLITAPDGKPAEAQNRNTGKYRSTFDVALPQQGTYKIAMINDGLLANWKEDGKPKRWRGTVESFAKEVPANAQDLEVTQAQSRVETFVTNGKPSTLAFKPLGRGLELVPVTNPTDLVASDPATFMLLLDGKPAQNIKVSVVPGGSRYRDKVNDFTSTTGADGKFSIQWPSAGMYFIEASTSDTNVAVKQAKQRRASYSATFEVAAP